MKRARAVFIGYVFRIGLSRARRHGASIACARPIRGSRALRTNSPQSRPIPTSRSASGASAKSPRPISRPPSSSARSRRPNRAARFSARPCLRRQSTIGRSHRRLPSGGRQGKHGGHGRTRRALCERHGRYQGRSPRRGSCSSARPMPATRAASAISRPSAAELHRTRSERGFYSRRRRRRIQRMRSISSA